MSIQQHMPDQAVLVDSWTLFCSECSRKMRIKTAAPSLGGMEGHTYRCTYECACGHSATFNVAVS